MTFKKKALISALLAVVMIAASSVSAFALTSHKYGDVDGNNMVNITDATVIQKKLLGIQTLDVVDNYNAMGDVNMDGDVNIRDVTLIQMYIAGSVTQLGDGWDPRIIQP